jgi:Ca-activated chloride channel homolog
MWGQSTGFAWSDVSVHMAQWCVSLKLLWWTADYSFVQRSALVTGLSLALAGMTLVGLGEWAERIDSRSADGRSGANLENSNYSRSPLTASPSGLPDLADTSDHLPANSPGYTFRHDVPEVRLQFTVADERGRLIRDLSPSDVEVFDDQSEVKRFSDFERDDNLPLQLGLVLDTSDSVKRVLPQEKRAAVDFLERVMRPQTDVAYVMAVAGDVKTWQKSTPNRQALVDAIDRLKEPGWGTRIFDALYSACSPKTETNEGKNVHRAIIVLTDGDDTDSLHTLQDVIAAAQRSETQIYPLTIHSRKIVTRGDRILSYLAESTGGRLYVANSAQALDASFAEIEQDLRTQYYVSFPPQESTPGYHSLRVEVRSPRKLEVHARQGYYALTQ